jgi:hypothetical protein
VPRTVAQYNTKPEKFRGTYDRVLKVIARMRSDPKISLQKALQLQKAAGEGISARTVKRWGKSALQKRTNGKWAAKRSDNLLRVLTVPTSQGTREIGVRGSRQATQLAEYWNAVQHYLATGDASRLEKFRGKSIKTADGTNITLITDRRELNRLGSAGVLNFHNLYSRST